MGNNCCQSAGPTDPDLRDRAEDVAMSEDSPILHTGDVRMPVAAQSAKSVGSRSQAKQEEDRKVHLNSDVETIVLPGEELQEGKRRDSEVARPVDADGGGAEANVYTGNGELEDGVSFKPSRSGEDDGPATFPPVIAPNPNSKRRGRKPTGVVTKAMLAAALEEEGEEEDEEAQGGGPAKNAKKEEPGTPSPIDDKKVAAEEDWQRLAASPPSAPEEDPTASVPLHLQKKGRRRVTGYMADWKIMRVLKFFGES